MAYTKKYLINEIDFMRQASNYIIGQYFAMPYCQPTYDTIINCSKKEIEYYASTPNNIIRVEQDGRVGFFRECRVHLRKREYLEKLFYEYCKYVFDNEHSKECYKILIEKTKNRKEFNQFFYMGPGTRIYSRITKFRKTKNADIIGIHKPYPNWFEEQLLQLVQYAWGALDEYQYSNRVKYGEYQLFNSSKTVATKIVADLFNCTTLIPLTKYVFLNIDGDVKFGAFVDQAKGVDPYSERIEGIKPSFQRDINKLQVLDTICFQKDHRPGNYYVVVNNGMAETVSAFDNDAPSTFLPVSNVTFNSYVGCNPLIKNGRINRPYMDIDSSMAIIEYNKEKILEKLNGIISSYQINAMMKRLEKIKRAILLSLKEKTLSLLKEDEWTQDCIEKELSGKYGMTYLATFVENCCEKTSEFRG